MLTSQSRKLPSLSLSLQPPTPIDNPALHQGRTRTSPHVEGQFAAYVYVPVFIDTRSALGKLLDDVVKEARELVPDLWDVGFLDVNEEGVADAELDGKRKKKKGERELHVSLSRPTYLRAHQRDELKRAVKTLAKNHPPYVFIHSFFSHQFRSTCVGNIFRHRFKSSFATFSELTNDERTRTFLTLEIGAGHHEVSSSSLLFVI
jgi:U6 snRNA phosphodiesterase